VRNLAGVESTLSGSTLTLGLEPVLVK
jgi:hypothetical protein